MRQHPATLMEKAERKRTDRLLKNELPLPTNMEPQIQRAHQALLLKPNVDKPPRSIMVNFLQYTVKESAEGSLEEEKSTTKTKHSFLNMTTPPR